MKENFAVTKVLGSYFVSSESVRVRSKVPGHEEAFSPGHNQIWIYDDVPHICKMAPTTRNTREGHFLALCCA